MFCNDCGNQIPEGTKFCNNGGASQEAVSIVEATAQPAPSQMAEQVTQKKNNTLLIAIVAAIAVVAIATVSIFALSGKDDNSTNSGNNGVVAGDTQIDADIDAETDSSVNDIGDNTVITNPTDKKLTAIDGGYNTGRAFLSDLGEFGKVSLSVGYNQDNGVIRQVAAAFTITVRHSEYDSMKSDFETWEERLSNSNDKNVEVSYVELSESVSFIIGITELNEADRADRVALAEEILDFVADEEDYAFYIDDITTLLTETYGFVVQE